LAHDRQYGAKQSRRTDASKTAISATATIVCHSLLCNPSSLISCSRSIERAKYQGGKRHENALARPRPTLPDRVVRPPPAALPTPNDRGRACDGRRPSSACRSRSSACSSDPRPGTRGRSPGSQPRPAARQLDATATSSAGRRGSARPSHLPRPRDRNGGVRRAIDRRCHCVTDVSICV
jgi:hypothetical protein